MAQQVQRIQSHLADQGDEIHQVPEQTDALAAEAGQPVECPGCRARHRAMPVGGGDPLEDRQLLVVGHQHLGQLAAPGAPEQHGASAVERFHGQAVPSGALVGRERRQTPRHPVHLLGNGRQGPPARERDVAPAVVAAGHFQAGLVQGGQSVASTIGAASL